jgi:hypothetical protein
MLTAINYSLPITIVAADPTKQLVKSSPALWPWPSSISVIFLFFSLPQPAHAPYSNPMDIRKMHLRTRFSQRF